MKILKLYLETTLWNYVVDNSSEVAEKKAATEILMRTIKKGDFEAHISPLVLEELNRAPEPKRGLMLKQVENIGPKVLPITEEARRLSLSYLREGAVPPQKFEDALHLAIAAVSELDVVVSWNYKHIVNLRRKEIVHGVNLKEGFMKPVEFMAPMEIADDE